MAKPNLANPAQQQLIAYARKAPKASAAASTVAVGQTDVDCSRLEGRGGGRQTVWAEAVMKHTRAHTVA